MPRVSRAEGPHSRSVPTNAEMAVAQGRTDSAAAVRASSSVNVSLDAYRHADRGAHEEAGTGAIRTTSDIRDARPLRPLHLEGAVGRGGKNRPADVMQVQQVLRGLGLLEDGFELGRADTATLEAIKAYQRQNGMAVVDGRIDVGKATMAHINQQLRGRAPRMESPAASPSRRQSAPAEPPAPPPAAPARPPALEEIDAAFVSGGGPDASLEALQRRSVEAARAEWARGVREYGATNRSARVDQYARNADFSPGGEWCGFFTAFNYSQNGFHEAPSLASYQKARDFFMYRSYTKETSDPSQKRQDALRARHEAGGSTRQYFMLEESQSIRRIARDPKRYGHVDAAAHTFDFHSLPIRPGDTALFHKGHVGMVESYDPASGRLTTVEGNATGWGADGKRHRGAVVRSEYDLSDPRVRAKFDGFGRPALGDFQAAPRP